jgi:prevent-host-death family protein
MHTMSISKFKATCLAVLERVRKTGEPLLITKHGVPIAQVLPAPPPPLLGVGFTHRHAPQLATTLATAPRMLGCLARAPAPTAREGARAGR